MLLLIFFLLIFLSVITTIPLSIPLIVISTVIFRKNWVFFLSLGLGFIIDLFQLRPLGQTGLFFVVFTFLVFQYSRKFETQTMSFVFISSFIGSLTYLKIFEYQNIFLQSFISALLAALFFKLIIKTLNHSLEISN